MIKLNEKKINKIKSHPLIGKKGEKVEEKKTLERKKEKIKNSLNFSEENGNKVKKLFIKEEKEFDEEEGENEEIIINDRKKCECLIPIFNERKKNKIKINNKEFCINKENRSKKWIIIRNYIIYGKKKIRIMAEIENAYKIRKSHSLPIIETENYKNLETKYNNQIKFFIEETKEIIKIRFNEQEKAKNIQEIEKILNKNLKEYYNNKKLENRKILDKINPIFNIIKEEGIYIYFCGLKNKKLVLAIPYFLETTY